MKKFVFTILISFCGFLLFAQNKTTFEVVTIASGTAINPIDWDIPEDWAEVQLSLDIYEEYSLLQTFIFYDNGTGLRYGYEGDKEPEEFIWKKLKNGYIQYKILNPYKEDPFSFHLFSKLPTGNEAGYVSRTFIQSKLGPDSVKFYSDYGVAVLSEGHANFELLLFKKISD